MSHFKLIKNSKRIEEGILNDYPHGLLHLLWLYKKNERKLIFAEFEMYPQCIYDIGESIGEAESNEKLSGKIDNREQCLRLPDGSIIFFIRIKKQALELISIYKNITKTQLLHLDWCKDGSVCNTEDVKPSTPWPYFALGSRVHNDDVLTSWPYLAQAWGASRTHHLLSPTPKDWLEPALGHFNSSKWLKERLGWDLSEYPELWGSAHLTLPNPLYYRLNIKSIPAPRNTSNDSIEIVTCKRSPQVAGVLHIILLEKKISGMMARPPLRLPLQAGFSKDNSSIELPGGIEQLACIVFCPIRGLLDYLPFTGVLKTMRLSFSFPQVQQITIVNEDGAQQIERTNTQGEVITLGDIPQLDRWGSKVFRSRRERASQKAAEDNGQVWLDTPEMAKTKIKSILEHAETVLIVDPYFSYQEFIDFVVAICPENVKATIVTGCAGLGNNSKERKHRGKLLINLLDELHKMHSWRIEFEVMTGGKPLIHDRFIVVNNNTVWLSGTSLNEIGTRGCIITKLHDFKGIISKINEARSNKDRVKMLSAYIDSLPGDDTHAPVNTEEQ